jgi:hypothetical protein
MIPDTNIRRLPVMNFLITYLKASKLQKILCHQQKLKTKNSEGKSGFFFTIQVSAMSG